MTYPRRHTEIVTSLLEGKFITVDDHDYDILRESFESFYEEFFRKSFDFELKRTIDFFYLVSRETDEKTSRDLGIFFSILCYELDKDGRNFIDELNYSNFEVDEIIDYFKNSAWIDIIKANKQLSGPESIKKFIGTTMVKRNIVIKNSPNNFSFTKAYKLFLDFAKELVVISR